VLADAAAEVVNLRIQRLPLVREVQGITGVRVVVVL